jgi:hypothetical protein
VWASWDFSSALRMVSRIAKAFQIISRCHRSKIWRKDLYGRIEAFYAFAFPGFLKTSEAGVKHFPSYQKFEQTAEKFIVSFINVIYLVL